MVERRGRENRGAVCEAPRTVGAGGGLSPPAGDRDWGGAGAPSPEIFF